VWADGSIDPRPPCQRVSEELWNRSIGTSSSLSLQLTIKRQFSSGYPITAPTMNHQKSMIGDPGALKRGSEAHHSPNLQNFFHPFINPLQRHNSRGLHSKGWFTRIRNGKIKVKLVQSNNNEFPINCNPSLCLFLLFVNMHSTTQKLNAGGNLKNLMAFNYFYLAKPYGTKTRQTKLHWPLSNGEHFSLWPTRSSHSTGPTGGAARNPAPRQSPRDNCVPLITMRKKKKTPPLPPPPPPPNSCRFNLRYFMINALKFYYQLKGLAYKDHLTEFIIVIALFIYP